MMSSELKFLLLHSSIYGLGTVVSRLVSFLLLPLYTRYLTPADYGILETIDVSTGLIGMVIAVGIARALSRFYYEAEDEKERNRVVGTSFITYSAIVIPFLPILFWVSDPLAGLLFKSHNYGLFFRLSFATMIMGGEVDIGMMYLRLIKKPVVFISVTTARLLALVGLNIVFIVYLKMGILGILYSSLIVSSTCALVLTTAILLRLGIRFSRSISREILRYGLPMIPSNLAGSAVRQSDKYFVLYFLSIADMGIYGLALKLGNAIHSLLTIPFNMAYIPRRFEILEKGEARETYSKIFTYYIFLIGYIGLALSVLVPEVLKVMVSPDFLRAGKFVPLVVFSMIIFGCHYHFDFGILQSKKTEYLAYISLSCAVINFGANFILIREFGLWGGVLSAVIVLGLQAFLLYRVSQKLYYIPYEIKRISYYVLMALGFYGVSMEIGSDYLLFTVFLKLVLLIAFPVAVWGAGVISRKEKLQIRELYVSKVRRNILKGAAFRTK